MDPKKCDLNGQVSIYAVSTAQGPFHRSETNVLEIPWIYFSGPAVPYRSAGKTQPSGLPFSRILQDTHFSKPKALALAFGES